MPINLDKKQIDEQIKEEKKDNLEYQYDFSEEKKKEIAELICWKADQYEGARTEWLEKITEARKLYEGDTGHIKSPYPDLPVISTMITTWVVDLLVAKLFPLVWNENLIYWKGREATDIDNSENISKFMRFIIVEELKMSGVIQQLIQDMLIDGTFAVKIPWNITYRWVQRIKAVGLTSKVINLINRVTKKYESQYEYKRFDKALVERIAIEDILTPWDSKNSDEDDLFHRVYYDYNTLKDFADRGYLIDVDENIRSQVDEKANKSIGGEKAKQEAEGTTDHERKPNENPIECIEAYMSYSVNGKLTQSVFFVSRTQKKYLSGKPLIAISRIEQRPIYVAPLLERSGRLLGKSIAMVVAPLHKEMDAIHNQRIQAGTIAIAPPGFYRPASGFKPKKTQYGPGWLLPLDDPTKDIFFPAFAGDLLRVSFQEETSVLGLIERLTSATSYSLGMESDIAKSRATATGTLALIGQAEQRFTTLAKKVQDSISEILVRVLRQYQEKMPPGLASRILGKEGERIFPSEITPEDIAGEYDCYLELDFAASNRAMEKQMAVVRYQSLISNPLIGRDPALLWELTADFVRATGNGKNVERIIGNKPPSLEAYNADADLEFVEMNEGKHVDIKQNENAIAHLIAHIAQRKSDRYVTMPIEYRPLLDEHIYKTQMLVQLQLMQQVQAAERAQTEQIVPGASMPPQNMEGGIGGEQPSGQAKPPAGFIGAPGVGQVAGNQAGIGTGIPG